MKNQLLDFLVCPSCLPRESKLLGQVLEREGDDILSGSLRCEHCGAEFPIQEGIASLLPALPDREEKVHSKYELPSTVSVYLWSHFGDLSGDREASAAYGEWVDLVGSHRGFSLDAGCAVGRFAFEMSAKCDFAVGIDNSTAFIRVARELMKNRQLKIDLLEEGYLKREEMIHLPETWNSDSVEFIVGDAQSLPFRSDLFSSLASLNLVDKIPLPLIHLKEMNRVALDKDAQFLFTDPFSWSRDVAREEDWLGGTTKGPYSGNGIDNIRSLLTGEKEGLSCRWKVENQGHVWWKIRNHRNHFELIRSCFIKAAR